MSVVEWVLLFSGAAFGFVSGALFTVLMLVPSRLWRREKPGQDSAE